MVDLPSPAPLLVITSVFTPRCRCSWTEAASDSKYESSTMSAGRLNPRGFRSVDRSMDSPSFVLAFSPRRPGPAFAPSARAPIATLTCAGGSSP